jgi:hypothetical protein
MHTVSTPRGYIRPTHDLIREAQQLVRAAEAHNLSAEQAIRKRCAERLWKARQRLHRNTASDRINHEALTDAVRSLEARYRQEILTEHGNAIDLAVKIAEKLIKRTLQIDSSPLREAAEEAAKRFGITDPVIRIDNNQTAHHKEASDEICATVTSKKGSITISYQSALREIGTALRKQIFTRSSDKE